MKITDDTGPAKVAFYRDYALDAPEVAICFDNVHCYFLSDKEMGLEGRIYRTDSLTKVESFEQSIKEKVNTLNTFKNNCSRIDIWSDRHGIPLIQSYKVKSIETSCDVVKNYLGSEGIFAECSVLFTLTFYKESTAKANDSEKSEEKDMKESKTEDAHFTIAFKFSYEKELIMHFVGGYVANGHTGDNENVHQIHIDAYRFVSAEEHSDLMTGKKVTLAYCSGLVKTMKDIKEIDICRKASTYNKSPNQEYLFKSVKSVDISNESSNLNPRSVCFVLNLDIPKYASYDNLKQQHKKVLNGQTDVTAKFCYDTIPFTSVMSFDSIVLQQTQAKLKNELVMICTSQNPEALAEPDWYAETILQAAKMAKRRNKDIKELILSLNNPREEYFYVKLKDIVFTQYFCDENYLQVEFLLYTPESVEEDTRSYLKEGKENNKVNEESSSKDIRPNVPYYTSGRSYQPIDVINDWGLNFNLGNVVKYIARAGRKPGADTIDDLRKARDYVDFEIDRIKKYELKD